MAAIIAAFVIEVMMAHLDNNGDGRLRAAPSIR
jgi:hypothetical protein